MRTPDIRIPVDRLAGVGKPLFDKSFQSGSDLARKLVTNTNTVWSWFFRRGLTPDNARQIADILDDRAQDLTERAGQLRMLAQQFDSGKPVPAEPAELKKVIKRTPPKVVGPRKVQARKQAPQQIKPVTPKGPVKSVKPQFRRLTGSRGNAI